MTLEPALGRTSTLFLSPGAAPSVFYLFENSRANIRRDAGVDASGAFNEYTVSIDGVPCDNDELHDPVRSGSVIRLDAAVAGACQDTIVFGGADHSITVTVVGTIILSGTVEVRS